MNKLIAVVDDDPDVLEVVSTYLKETGFRVKEFPDAGSLLRFLNTQIPDLIILDLRLPDADGFETCKYLRKKNEFSHIPIIMLTGKSEEMDRVLGLELGADDYVTKPFSTRELVARVKAVLRRREQKGESKRIEIGNILKIDLQKFQVTIEGKNVELTPTEFRILKMLCERKGWICTRKQILDYLWGNEKIVVDRTVDVHIKNLKKKVCRARKFIKSVRGIGYKLEE